MFEALICELGVGDCCLAQELPRVGIRRRSSSRHDSLAQQLIDEYVNPAQEKARHGGDRVERFAGRVAALERAHVSLCHDLIARDRKQEGDVDVDSLEQ